MRGKNHTVNAANHSPSDSQSPFRPAANRLSFGLDWMLLVMLVAATTAALAGYALTLPAVTSELNAWLGRTVDIGEAGQARQAHIVFLLACYSAPLILSLVARVVYLVGKAISAERPQSDPDADKYRME